MNLLLFRFCAHQRLASVNDMDFLFILGSFGQQVFPMYFTAFDDLIDFLLYFITQTRAFPCLCSA